MISFANSVRSEDTFLSEVSERQVGSFTNDGFSDRLRSERKRLGLNQADFASLGGVATPSQVRYETGSNSPKLDYLARLAVNGVDVLYVLTAERNAAAAVDPNASELLTLFHALPHNMKRVAVALLQALRDESETDRTLHQPKTNYRAE